MLSFLGLGRCIVDTRHQFRYKVPSSLKHRHFVPPYFVFSFGFLDFQFEISIMISTIFAFVFLLRVKLEIGNWKSKIISAVFFGIGIYGEEKESLTYRSEMK